MCLNDKLDGRLAWNPKWLYALPKYPITNIYIFFFIFLFPQNFKSFVSLRKSQLLYISQHNAYNINLCTQYFFFFIFQNHMLNTCPTKSNQSQFFYHLNIWSFFSFLFAPSERKSFLKPISQQTKISKMSE